MAKSKKLRPGGKQRSNRTKPLPTIGDHGTGTTAATAGTVVEMLEDPNPNRIARRRRVSQLDEWSDRLSMRQMQAARAIESAWCGVEQLSSGGALKEQVDSTPRPDAVIAAQVDAMSRWQHVIGAVPSALHGVVEHICCKNLPLSDLAKGGRQHHNRTVDFKIALELVADRLRY